MEEITFSEIISYAKIAEDNARQFYLDAAAKATQSNVKELLEALALAFRDNPMNVAIHGSNPRRRVRANRAGLRALVLDSADQAIARVIRHEDRVVGGFIVVPPGGFPMARQKLDTGAKKKDIDFYEGQLKTADFFIQTILPATIGKMDGIVKNNSSVIDISDAAFGG